MQWTNTDEDYGLVAKIFHWVIALLILGLLPMGLVMTGLPNSPFKGELYGLHKSFGLLVFFLGLARIVWKLVSPPPDPLASHAYWERTLAGAAHFWLYVCVLGIPLTGWLMSSALGYPAPFFGFNMPALTGKNEDLGEFFEEAHEILAWTLLFVLALHAAGALKHHVLDRDLTLQRMTSFRRGLLVPALIILVTGLSYGASGIAILREESSDHHEAADDSQDRDEAQTSTLNPLSPEEGWRILTEESQLRFETTLYGAPMTGEFTDFAGRIIFDPADLTSALADISIPLSGVKTGDTGRDETLKGPDWFDVASFPEARFTTLRFEQAGDEKDYKVVGELMMRGITMPVILPAEIRVEDDKARMKAEVTLNRLDFGIGVGEWADEKTVGHAVTIKIDLRAIR